MGLVLWRDQLQLALLPATARPPLAALSTVIGPLMVASAGKAERDLACTHLAQKLGVYDIIVLIITT